MRVDAKSMFLRLAFAFKANLTLCLLVSLWLEQKLWLLAVVSFCGSQFGENSRTFSFWAGRQGNRQAGSPFGEWEGLANNYGQPCMEVKIINIFLIGVAEFGRLWGIAKNAFNSFVWRFFANLRALPKLQHKTSFTWEHRFLYFWILSFF